MAFDMSQFHAVFFEESSEHLANMEQLLLAINLASPDDEDLNAIFRAAHSIKGSAGTFGFNDLAEVTHDLETLLDLVRKGEMPLTEAIVDVSLVAGDVLKNLLAAHQGLGVADLQASVDVRARIVALLRGEPGPLRKEVRDGLPPELPAYLLRFQVSGEAREVLTVNLLAELSEQGRVSVVEDAVDDGRLCLRVETSASTDTLRELLGFVVDIATLTIEATSDAPAPAAEGEAYGFFIEPGDKSLTLHSDGDSESFGFFGPVDALQEEGDPLAEIAASRTRTVPAEDASFGLFDAPPASQPAPAAVKLATPAAEARPVKSASAAAANEVGSIRVGVEKVDQMINLVGELVITQAMLAQAASELDPVRYERLLSGLGQLERNTRDLQESVMGVRMLPISTVFTRFPRVVRDLSQKLGKKVQLVTSGEHTELDKTLIERITDPLTHLVRNSLDHGIESAEARLAAGKVEQGTISLRAYHQSGNIVIEVSDDGAGLQRDRILAKARERGMHVSDAMSDQEVWLLIFEPGFSTAEQVTDVSGRGVGMDVVKRNIAALNGRIEIDSMAGVGTRVTVRLPLTLAILDGMSVGVANETYIIPLDYVVESLQPTASMIKSVSGNECLIQVRGAYLPVLSLRQLFGVAGPGPRLHEGIMVVLETDGVQAALCVDQLIGQHQVVIKSLEANYRRVAGIAGATIMGDGRVGLILDAAALIGMARKAMPAAA